MARDMRTYLRDYKIAVATAKGLPWWVRAALKKLGKLALTKDDLCQLAGAVIAILEVVARYTKHSWDDKAVALMRILKTKICT